MTEGLQIDINLGLAKIKISKISYRMNVTPAIKHDDSCTRLSIPPRRGGQTRVLAGQRPEGTRRADTRPEGASAGDAA